MHTEAEGLMESEADARARLAAMESASEAYIVREIEAAAGRIFANEPELRARWLGAMERALYGDQGIERMG